MVVRDVATPGTGDGVSLLLSPPNVQQHLPIHTLQLLYGTLSPVGPYNLNIQRVQF